MREILFRGKAVNLHNGSKYFVYGQYVQNRDGKMIYSDTWEDGIQKHYVIEGTVGQYTGLTDKNGKKIFEGDILVFCKGATHPIKVYWDGLGWKFLRNGKNIEDAFECNTIDHIRFCEIIGNIHDNPELMKGGE